MSFPWSISCGNTLRWGSARASHGDIAQNTVGGAPSLERRARSWAQWPHLVTRAMPSVPTTTGPNTVVGAAGTGSRGRGRSGRPWRRNCPCTETFLRNAQFWLCFTISDIASLLEAIAPPVKRIMTTVASSWATPIVEVLVSLDVTEAVVAEAGRGRNLIVSTRSFRAMKRLTGRDAVGRTVMAALRAGVSMPSTSLDNVAHGVNAMMADKLGPDDFEALRPVQTRPR